MHDRGRPLNPSRPGARWGMRAGVALGVGAAAAAGWRAAHRRDLRRVAADPANALLSDRPRGERSVVISADGTHLAVESFGPADAPPLLMVHGWTCARRFWICQVHALADRFRIVTFDLRGHGDSEAPRGGDFSTDALADDVQAVLEQAIPPAADGRPRRALVVGHSLGAMSLVAWAGRHPGEVERRAAGAALCNTGVGDLISESIVFRLPAGMRRVKALAGAAFLQGSAPLPRASPLSMRAIRYVALSPQASPAQVAFCQEMVLSCRRDVRAGCGRTLSRLDLSHALDALTVPTLVLGGGRDRLTPPPHVDRLAAALPDVAEVVRLPESGHMSPLEDPAAVDGAVERLAARVGLVPAPAPAAT